MTHDTFIDCLLKIETALQKKNPRLCYGSVRIANISRGMDAEMFVEKFVSESSDMLENIALKPLKDNLIPLVNAHFTAFKLEKPLKRKIQALRKKCYDRKVFLAEREGTMKVPTTVIRNSLLTSQNIPNAKKLQDLGLYDQNGARLSLANVAENHKDVLKKQEAKDILDAIYFYMMKSGDKNKAFGFRINEEQDTIIISDTWNHFCEMAGVRGEDRRRVKNALFPQDGTAPLLERIQFIHPDTTKDGKLYRYIRELRFVSVRESTRTHRKNTLENMKTTTAIKDFEIDVNLRVFATVLMDGYELRSDLNYYNQPISMHMKIRDYLRFVKKIAQIGSKESPQLTLTVQLQEELSNTIVYLFDQWITGSEARKTPRIFTFKELSEQQGHLPLYNRRDAETKKRRQDVMETLYRLILGLQRHEEGNLFPGCKGIQFDPEAKELAITLYPFTPLEKGQLEFFSDREHGHVEGSVHATP